MKTKQQTKKGVMAVDVVDKDEGKTQLVFIQKQYWLNCKQK